MRSRGAVAAWCALAGVHLVACSTSTSDRTSTSEPSGTQITLITAAPSTDPATTDVAGTSTNEDKTRPKRRAKPNQATTSAVPANPPPTTTTTIPQPTTTTGPSATPYAVPVANVAAAGWGEGHSSYPATDIFASCGADVVSPVNGIVTEVRSIDSWDPGIDNPATRGGRSVTIVGDDGVRYYLSHLDQIDALLVPQQRVAAGQRLGTVGLTGRTSGCHVHFGISPPCPGEEWSIRRGAIPPERYLNAWRNGQQTSPVDEIETWSASNSDACAVAMADPFAKDS